MSTFAEKIIKMIDDGYDIFEMSKIFGGIESLLELSSKYPYLQGLIMTKLGGLLYCSVPNEDEVMVPFELPFILIDLETVDIGDMNHYNAYVDIILPELKNNEDIRKVFSWLDDYLADMGAEVGTFNDPKLNRKMIWINISKINGESFDNTEEVSDEEILKLIPKEYYRD